MCGGGGRGGLARPKKNTETFTPSHTAPPLRVVVAQPGLQRFDRLTTTRDVVIVNDLFGDPADLSTYRALLQEIQTSGVAQDEVWKPWHGDSHLIADDKVKGNWKGRVFTGVVERIRDYFQMDIKATRLNWYRNTSEWKVGSFS